MFETRLRAFIPSDVNYVLKTFLRDMHYSKSRLTPDKVFYEDLQNVFMSLTHRADAWIACDPNDPNFIHGFVVGRTFPDINACVVHYAFVRREFRRLGIGKELLKGLGFIEGKHEVVATHTSPILEKFKRNDLIYNRRVLYDVAGKP